MTALSDMAQDWGEAEGYVQGGGSRMIEKNEVQLKEEGRLMEKEEGVMFRKELRVGYWWESGTLPQALLTL